MPIWKPPRNSGEAGQPDLEEDGLGTGFADISAAISAGDDSAEIVFERIYRQQRGRVLSVVRAVLGPHHGGETEDVVQLAFIEIHRSLPGFEGRARLTTWIHRITVNVALQHLRRIRRRRWLTLYSSVEGPAMEPRSAHPIELMEDREALRHVYAAADLIKEKKRVVWVLHEIQGKALQEISEILEVPLNTVRSRLVAAKREIRATLARKGFK